MVDTVKILRPEFASEADNPTGRVAHDERGNAIWKWSQDLEILPFQFDASTLTVADDAPSPVRNVTVNKAAAKSGYNPYESGLILKKRAKKRDLRELSRWIEARKRSADDSQA